MIEYGYRNFKEKISNGNPSTYRKNVQVEWELIPRIEHQREG